MKGLVDLAFGRLAGALVEVGIELVVEPEEVEPVEAKPLMGEARGEVVRFLVGEQSVDLRRQHRRLAEFSRGGKRQQLRVGRRGPEEVGEPRGKFAIGEPPRVLVTVVVSVVILAVISVTVSIGV